MISRAEEEFILDRARIPEHIPSLMRWVSGGEAYLDSGYLTYAGEDWIIFVGYPLVEGAPVEEALHRAMARASPRRAFVIAPTMPSSLPCQERETDWYYTLELGGLSLGKSLRYRVRKASRTLRVERGGVSSEHRRMVKEFLETEKPGKRVEELFRRLPGYASEAGSCVVLNALDRDDNLAAFYLVEVSPRDFAAYLIGCYSRKNPVPGASDLLFHEMIALAREMDKGYINLGLGVNPGIRKFKEKWGGRPTIKYESCYWDVDQAKALELMRRWGH
jgi:hypothetical protein